MKRFEYKEERITKNTESILSEMGAKGWQLVAVSNSNFYFMREVKGDE
ncbi:MAG: hypothetical protein ACFFDN_49850 [Candidatus Hodarchaeota archaeon]